MIEYSLNNRSQKHRTRKIIIGLLVVLLVVLAGVLFLRQAYIENLKPAGTSMETQEIVVQKGATLREVSIALEDAKLIQNRFVFELYARYGGGRGELRAGTYALRPNMSVQEIVSIITDGKVVTSLFTILPGQRLDQIRTAFIEADFNSESVDAALDPAQYADHSVYSYLPAGASLEGLLYPDSFQRTSETTPAEIIRQSLDLMEEKLTTDIAAGFARAGLSVYEGIIVASIVEREVTAKNPDDRPMVARVFLNRIAQNMKLGSDVTAIYGATVAGQDMTVNESIGFDSPYNTRIRTGLPPGPISNVSVSSLSAVANPADHDYLYFVSGDDGLTYYAKTYEEHLRNVDNHCFDLCNL